MYVLNEEVNMADNLVIVESAAKVNTISRFLGKNYKVEASIGHVRDLPKSQLGIDTENNIIGISDYDIDIEYRTF